MSGGRKSVGYQLENLALAAFCLFLLWLFVAAAVAMLIIIGAGLVWALSPQRATGLRVACASVVMVAAVFVVWGLVLSVQSSSNHPASSSEALEAAASPQVDRPAASSAFPAAYPVDQRGAVKANGTALAGTETGTPQGSLDRVREQQVARDAAAREEAARMRREAAEAEERTRIAAEMAEREARAARDRAEKDRLETERQAELARRQTSMLSLARGTYSVAPYSIGWVKGVYGGTRGESADDEKVEFTLILREGGAAEASMKISGSVAWRRSGTWTVDQEASLVESGDGAIVYAGVVVTLDARGTGAFQPPDNRVTLKVWGDGRDTPAALLGEGRTTSYLKKR